jgi:ankyrin repeat protein
MKNKHFERPTNEILKLIHDFRTACDTYDTKSVIFLLEFRYIQDNLNNLGVLYSCCMRGHIDIVKILIQNGADPIGKDNEYFENAACAGNYELVEYFLNEHNANPTTHNNYAIEKAYSHRHDKIVELLFSKTIVKNTLINTNNELYNKLMVKYINNKISSF